MPSIRVRGNLRFGFAPQTAQTLRLPVGIQEKPQTANPNPQTPIPNPMIDNTTLASLQRSLAEYREAKRKTKTRLAEIEAEAEMLRSQLATIDAIIEQTETALRKVLFPADYSDSRADSQTDNRSGAYEISPYRPSEVEIEA